MPILNASSARTGTDHRFRRETGLAGQIADIVEPRIEALGFRLVRVSVTGRNGNTVQIMAERPDGRLSIGECELLSRDISPAVDVSDLISSRYHLEVSSPGIDRPLVRPRDFESWAGHEARLELKEPIDGQRRLRGRLEGFTDGEVRIEIDASPGDGKPDGPNRQTIGVPITLVESARLLLTDELIREDLKRSRQQEPTAETESENGEPLSETNFEMDFGLEKSYGPDRG
jgi:ribosome maturation factor RimP